MFKDIIKFSLLTSIFKEILRYTPEEYEGHEVVIEAQNAVNALRIYHSFRGFHF